MKQLFQDLGGGGLEIVDVPAPTVKSGHVVIRTSHSLVSPGTERMLRDFGKANPLQKVLKQRERVKEVLQKAQTDGIMPTIEAVRAKLEQPMPIGYCNVGRVIAVAPDVAEFKIGDRVVSNGPHAEIVRVPKNLVAKVPEGVGDDAAAFTVLCSIALQGVRLAELGLGACAVVSGLGLIGLLAVQLLRAQGARVLGIDPDESRCALARQFGADTFCLTAGSDPLKSAEVFSRGRGVDAVIICASTKSNDPIAQAAKMARKRGRIVLVGVVGLDVPRNDFYQKELTFQVSCSYGPGRYDPSYEEQGHDYPVGFVRWTMLRNFEAILDMFEEHKIDISALLSCRFPIDAADKAYEKLDEGGGILGIMLDYPEQSATAEAALRQTTVSVAPARNRQSTRDAPRIGLIGAGNYAARMLIPALVGAGAVPAIICASGGSGAAFAGRKFAFEKLTSESSAVIEDDSVDLVVIATRHDSHASLAAKALHAGKAVFVEKPLALTDSDVDQVREAWNNAKSPFLMVGFNRRFAPSVVKLREAIVAAGEPPAINITVNAGPIPPDHWTQDRIAGGGRMIGEGCHFIDLARHLAGASVVRAEALAVGPIAGDANPEDKASILLGFANGAVATIQYLANGHKSFPKERIDLFCGGRVWQIDNFRKMSGFGSASQSPGLFGRMDKGQNAMASAVIAALRAGNPPPIAFDQLIEVAELTIDLDRRLRSG